jgi:glucose-6-phosphate isomerase
MLPKINPTKTIAWEQLIEHKTRLAGIGLKKLFEKDPNRFEQFHGQIPGLLFDYSKNLLDSQTLESLLLLAENCGLAEAKEQLFGAYNINETENRAVLHMALRGGLARDVVVDGMSVNEAVQAVLKQMEAFCHAVIAGEWKGHTAKPIQTIVNIGIGGSDLGPVMVTEALQAFKNHLKLHFVSNVDGAQLTTVLKQCDPETTLFLIASKTFTTQETMANAYSARQWLLQSAGNETAIARHFVAISTNQAAVQSFGIESDNMFRFWDWVGGRFSLWSAIGLSIALSIGFDRFKELLAGAAAMDKHFYETKAAQNLPVLMALIGIWNTNFLGAQTEAILPYAQDLHRFPAYLQQAAMESNGKSVDRNGQSVRYATSPIIWGEPGTNGQHAFYQLLHQGTQFVPCDFIAFVQASHDLEAQHQLLLANFVAQSQALLWGKSEATVMQEAKAQGMTATAIEKILPFKVFEGNRPSNSILLKVLDPYHLGMLIALYEHKIFCQGIIWNIFSFDQWGVELGKEMANKLTALVADYTPVQSLDSSTKGLLQAIATIKAE